MFVTRFPCLVNSPRRRFSQLTLASFGKWIKIKNHKQPPGRLESSPKWQKLTATPLKLSKLEIGPRGPRPPPPVFKGGHPELEYENIVIGERFPVSFRKYHPPKKSDSETMIFYIPPPPTSHFFPSEQIITLLSYMTSATIVIPTTSDMIKPFPQFLHNLSQIYDHCNPEIMIAPATKSAVALKSPPTLRRAFRAAILSAGMAAPFAVSMAVTEPSISAAGIWGGVLDLTAHAEKATAWDRELEMWKHFRPPSGPFASSATTNRIGMTVKEFWQERARYFPNPEIWDDPFASPHLFFRDSPLEFSRLTMKQIWGAGKREDYEQRLESMKKVESLEQDELPEQGERLWHSSPDYYEDEGNLIYPRSQAKLMKKFPPTDAKTFPWMRLVLPAVEEGEDDVATTQGVAFADVARLRLVDWFKRQRFDSRDAMEKANELMWVDRLEAGERWEIEVAVMAGWLKSALDGTLKEDSETRKKALRKHLSV